MSAVMNLDTVPLITPRLSIDLAALAANVEYFARLTRGRLMAVVKADGFGHGAVDVARTALRHGATHLGVATIDEALALRRAGLAAPILAWLATPDANYPEAIRAGVDVTVPSRAHLDAIRAAVRATGVRARVHLQIDTGMARDGAPRSEWVALCADLATDVAQGTCELAGLMGHLPRAAERDDPSNDHGRDEFLAALAVARAAGLEPRVLHLAATAAAIADPRNRFDLCRIGAGLYGIGSPDLTWATRLTAPVAMVRDVASGAAVGYDHTWRADAATRLALVPLGYADGIPRAASNRAEVLVQGRRCPVVGLVSMDQLVVDVGDLPVVAGDEVVLFGSGSEGEPTLGDWAEWSDTIPHELMTRVGARIERGVR